MFVFTSKINEKQTRGLKNRKKYTSLKTHKELT